MAQLRDVRVRSIPDIIPLPLEQCLLVHQLRVVLVLDWCIYSIFFSSSPFSPTLIFRADARVATAQNPSIDSRDLGRINHIEKVRFQQNSLPGIHVIIYRVPYTIPTRRVQCTSGRARYSSRPHIAYRIVYVRRRRSSITLALLL